MGPLTRRFEGKSLRVLAVQRNHKDLLELTELCVGDKIAPVIDQLFPLAKVPEALRHVGGGHAKGKVVVTLE